MSSSSNCDTTSIGEALTDVGRRLSDAAVSATSFPATAKLFETPPVKKILDADNGSALTEELLDALLLTNKGTLTRLDDSAFAAGCRVIVRADYEKQVKNARYVSVISGGGSGHEPAHAGFVGAGLLTAAVCGDVFASPSAKAVLAAIVATSSPKAGCLLIVKNYTGDRLNFGIAAETAKSRYGIPVETVYVADDVALDSGANARGVAGALLVHKAAGATAALGYSLKDVADAARDASVRVKTMGAAYEVCTLPGRPPSNRLGAAEVEIGLGIHGEPGFERTATPSASSLAATLADRTTATMDAGDVALIVNDLGTTTPMEMAVFGAASIRAVEARGFRVVRVLTGSLMTALDMHGVSLSVAPVDGKLLKLLDAPCAAPAMATGAWRVHTSAMPLHIAPDRSVVDNPPPAPVSGDLEDTQRALKALRNACEAVLRAESELTVLDEKVGDGDAGTTLAAGAKAVLAACDAGLPKGASGVVAAVARAVEDSMGGSSGVLYNLGLKAAETSLRQAAGRSVQADKAWCDAYIAFAEAISKCGGAGVGSRTMCDATLPAADVFRKGGTLAEAASAARIGADSTAALQATHGRSAYLNAEAQRGVVDPGAEAVARAFAAVAQDLYRAKYYGSA